ncbi:MAG: protein kinase [Verrucomicrobiota bacterium JB023]|nr:protein kinase [Verrucomicrobiota bacterium JB023]
MSEHSFNAPTLEELAPLFPAYSIDAFIAEGGMGAVYLGTQKSLDRQVAIKILPRELGADPSFRSAFEAEAKAMAKLNHPNLIGVYDFGEVDGMPFIIMEYVEGKSLYHSAYGKQIDPTEAARIVAATCRGLHHAHEHEILHRDVKPANILLGPDANPRLGDFGLALQMDGEDDGPIYGTPGYAAPEVYEGAGDTRSDTYAAAVILYELLTGQLPGDPYFHPSQLVQCDRRFDNLLSKALQPDPNERHQDAEEFAAELNDIIDSPAGSAVAAAPYRPAARTSLPSSKKGGFPMGLVAVLVLGAVGLGAFLMMGGNEEAEQAGSGQADAENENPVVVIEPTDDLPSIATTAPPAAPTSETIAAAEEEEDIETPLVEPVDDEPAEMADSAIARVAEVEENSEPEKPEVIEVAAKETKKEEKAQPRVAARPAEPEPEVPAFDHMGFLAKGRTTLRAQTKRYFDEHQESILKHINGLERDCKRVLRNVDYISRDTERAREHNLELYIKELTDKVRLPEKMPEYLPEALGDLTYNSEETKMALHEAIEAQATTDLKLRADLQAPRDLYVTGIERQVEALREEGRDHDADILQSEADATKRDIERFIAVMKGSDLQPPRFGDSPSGGSIVGKWTIEGTKPQVVFTLTADKKADNGVWRAKGYWEERPDHYHVTWEVGSGWIKLYPVSDDVLESKNASGSKRTLVRMK